MRAALLILAVAALTLACACGQAPPSPGPASLSELSELEPPVTHSPRVWWRANHMVFLQPQSPKPALLETAECALCHGRREFCGQCHNFVGAASTAGEE
ncbi:MAG: hypothetical protein PVG03_14295 [Desulfarculaceae bacterium]|jgi:hypothetical protein